MQMNKQQWLLYAASGVNVGIILLYISVSAINRDDDSLISWSRSWSSEFRSFSQKTVWNESLYEDNQSVERTSVSDRRVEKNREKPNQENLRIQGYALGWDYYEGQTCAARNLVGLQRWATSLNYGIVEPFVQESHFRTSAVFTNEKALRLSDYFDIDIWNHNVVTGIPHGAPLVSWEHFIKNAARQLIVVHVMISSKNGTKVYVNYEVKKDKCFFSGGFSNKTLSKFGFKVIRQVCFKFNRSPLPVDDFNKYILGPFKANNATVVFTFVPGVKRTRINILEEKYHCKFVEWLKPSKQVIKDARNYIDTFLDKNYTAVSLRTVKMAISIGSRHPTNIRETAKIVVDKCVNEITQILSNTSGPGQDFMTIDLGRFGDPKASKYFTSATATNIINKLINVTYHNSWNKVVWENTFIKATNGISDSGYIASLQKEIASHASVLITAGGGHFQDSMKLQHKLKSAQKFDVLQACSIDDLYPDTINNSV